MCHPPRLRGDATRHHWSLETRSSLWTPTPLVLLHRSPTALHGFGRPTLQPIGLADSKNRPRTSRSETACGTSNRPTGIASKHSRAWPQESSSVFAGPAPALSCAARCDRVVHEVAPSLFWLPSFKMKKTGGTVELWNSAMRPKRCAPRIVLLLGRKVIASPTLP